VCLYLEIQGVISQVILNLKLQRLAGLAVVRPWTSRLNLFTGSELKNLVGGNRHTNEDTDFIRKGK